MYPAKTLPAILGSRSASSADAAAQETLGNRKTPVLFKKDDSLCQPFQLRLQEALDLLGGQSITHDELLQCRRRRRRRKRYQRDAIVLILLLIS
ncbi:hypothetical protein MUK42_01476 [Musa troglodytarum]|uniref:Uncharacterized protein n=1 Tax=Musa troglodytarum TaxID=320322 RepID=A0A9E7JT51_9LILI|nr:hypothetical protein MUK42_01476 [Musa troglodytarum]